MKHNLDLSRIKYSQEELEEKNHLFTQIEWHYISIYQSLTENFIEKHSDKLIWDDISVYQQLSDEFIEKYIVKVNWYYICLFQSLSEEFIRKHINKMDVGWLIHNMKISQELRLKIKKEFNLLKEII
jgi:hypothetical protein